MKEGYEISRSNGWEDKVPTETGPDAGLTNLEIEEKEKKYDRKEDIESVAEWILNRANSKGRFSEKIPLKKDGSINIEATADVERSMIVQYAKTLNTSSVDDLTNFVDEIEKAHPEIYISIKPDRSGAWVEIIARVDQPVKIGDLVNWENNKTLMWSEPRKIVRIDSKDGEGFAFFEESRTGIPIKELHPWDKKE